jgi:riboflavin biosynthesis pyrimidine reductase
MNGAEAFGKAGILPKLRKASCTKARKPPSSAMLRPRISVNLAISADGKISSVNRKPSGWTSPQDHSRLLALRNNADALLVGRGTLEADRMTLTVPGKSVQPLRCIASKSGKIHPDHPIFNHPGGPIHLLITDETNVCEMPGLTIHHGNLKRFIETLASNFHVNHLHCEGGGTLVRALAELGAIDEFHLTLAGHALFGGTGAPTATGIPAGFLPASLEFEMSHFEPRPDLGECFLSYYRSEQAARSQ